MIFTNLEIFLLFILVTSVSLMKFIFAVQLCARFESAEVGSSELTCFVSHENGN